QDEIRFSVSGKIVLVAPLPKLTDASGGTYISADAMIEINGAELKNRGNGLYIVSPDNVIEGISILSFPENGILIEGPSAHNNVVRRCKIGSDGNTAIKNGNSGVVLSDGASNNTIGGTRNSLGNLISGNGEDGIV